jgi:hypothetical protein
MIGSKTYRFLIFFLLVVLVVACGGGPKATPTSSRWDDTQQESSGTPATSAESLPGSAFNKFFPKSGKGFDIVYTQEKEGFAEAKLKKDGDEIATLSISDTINNPSAAEKYKDSTETLAGYPVAEIGSKGTGILVADRFQVQVRSTVDDFEQGDREFWIQEFDLDDLAKLK